MTSPQIEIQLIAAMVAMACAIPGVFSGTSEDGIDK